MKYIEALITIALNIGLLVSIFAYARTDDQHYANWAILSAIVIYGKRQACAKS